MTELTIADHIIIKLKSRYSWFGSVLAKMDLETKKELRNEWISELKNVSEGAMHYALQQDSNHGIFSNKMEPYKVLKKIKQLCDEEQFGNYAESRSSRERLAEYNSAYDTLIKETSKKGYKNLSKEEWEEYRKEHLRLSTLIANEEVRLKRAS